MTKRVYGAKYDKTLRVKDIAEKIRREVRLEANLGLLPKGKWSVTSTFRSIFVSFAPTVEEDELFARAYWNRERVIEDVENTHGQNMRTLASEFGLALRARIEQKLADYNHDGSDTHSDYFDVNFYTTVAVSPRTDRPAMMDLYRAGEWEPKTVAELNAVWDAMWMVWKKEAAPPVVAEPPAPIVVKVGDTLTPEGGDIMRVHRVFPRTPEDQEDVAALAAAPAKPAPGHRDFKVLQGGLSNLTPLEKHDASMFEVRQALALAISAAGTQARLFENIPELRKLLDANARVRVTPRRASIAAAVEEPVPQVPNEAWLRLAQAYDLKLDWAIPGLGDGQ